MANLKQCKTCPWIIGNDPSNIPNGYELSLHKDLIHTIANPDDIKGQLQGINDNTKLRIMACHYSSCDVPSYCIGWLNNQLGVGNNIALRLKLLKESFPAHLIELNGKQHEQFEDTLP